MVVKDAVCHSMTVLAQFFSRCWPVRGVEWGRHTTGAINVARNILGTPTLNHLNFGGVAVIVRVQLWWELLHSHYVGKLY